MIGRTSGASRFNIEHNVPRKQAFSIYLHADILFRLACNVYTLNIPNMFCIIYFIRNNLDMSAGHSF